MNLVVVVCIVVAAIAWRYAFWAYSTREGASKSWTLLPDKDIKSFLNESTFMIAVVWWSTYFLIIDINSELPQNVLTTVIKVSMIAISLFCPTIGATQDLRHQIYQVD